METQHQTCTQPPATRNTVGTLKFVQAVRQCLLKQELLRAGSYKAWFVVLIMGVMLLWSGNVWSKSTTWTASAGGTWTSAGNWSSGVPAANDDVIIPTGTTGIISSVPTISLTSLTIYKTCTFQAASSGNMLTITGNLTVANGVTFTTGNSSGGNHITLASNAEGNIAGTISVYEYSSSYNRYFYCYGDLAITSTGVISGSGDFILYAGATLRIGSTAGINTSGTTGNIRTSGRTFSSAAHYVYNGTAKQNTGTGYPTGLTRSLTIDNPNTVTLSAAKTISSGTVILARGTFAAGTNLTLSTTSTINRSEGSISGTLQGTGRYNLFYTGNSKTAGPELQNTGLRNVTVNLNAGATLTSATNAFSVTENLSIQQGILDMQATNDNYTIAGNLSVSSGATLKHSQNWDTSGKQIIVNGNLAINGNYDYSSASRTHIGMYGAGSKTISASNTALSILTLTLGDISANGNLTINDNFWSMFGSTGSFSTNGQVVTANAGVLINGGTVNINGGSLNVTSGIQIGVGVLNGAVSLSNGVLNADFINIGDETLTGTLTQSGGTASIGSLAINATAGNAYTCSGSPAINVSGNWTNNRSATAFTPANSTVTFNGTAAQTIGGSFTLPFYNLAFTNTVNAITFNTAHNISNNLSVAAGAKANLGTFTHTAKTLTLGGNGASNGSWGGNGSAANNINTNWFADATGIINVTDNSCSAFPVVVVTPDNITCNGATDGSISISATGGNQPYSYSINNGITWLSGSIFSNLPATDYNIKVKDNNGCLQTNCSILP